jgi:hypothetical protein
MIVEMRTYQVQPGKAAEFLRMYQDNGLQIITQYARLLGCWTKESGVLNSVVFLWAYDDMGHRSSQRATMAQDGAPGKRFPQSGGLLSSKVNAPVSRHGAGSRQVAASCP